MCTRNISRFRDGTLSSELLLGKVPERHWTIVRRRQWVAGKSLKITAPSRL
jgi:hypothetical protein